MDDNYQDLQDFDAEQEAIANANAQGEAEAQAMSEQAEAESMFGLDKLTIYRSYTCCNVEVHAKNGTEIICPECKEYCITKGK
jgi:hypothetical protein